MRREWSLSVRACAEAPPPDWGVLLGRLVDDRKNLRPRLFWIIQRPYPFTALDLSEGFCAGF